MAVHKLVCVAHLVAVRIKDGRVDGRELAWRGMGRSGVDRCGCTWPIVIGDDDPTCAVYREEEEDEEEEDEEEEAKEEKADEAGGGDNTDGIEESEEVVEMVSVEEEAAGRLVLFRKGEDGGSDDPIACKEEEEENDEAMGREGGDTSRKPYLHLTINSDIRWAMALSSSNSFWAMEVRQRGQEALRWMTSRMQS